MLISIFIFSVVLITDSKVYVWHRESGALLEELAGHGDGSVNSVAWNPRNEKMFASCSDDHTVRIWEATQSFSEMERDRMYHRNGLETVAMSNGKGKEKSAVRQRWDGTDVSNGAGSSSGLGDETAAVGGGPR